VALAAALEADVCEIYTDVDGIFTADPGLVPDARKLDEITFDEMYEYATAGAGVLMPSSVEFGRRYLIPIHVRSSLHDGAGTWVREETEDGMGICGVASSDAGTVSVVGAVVRTEPDVAVRVKEILSDAGIVGEEVQGSDLRLSYLVPSAEAAVRALHEGLIGGSS
jgi:aspartate kinase